MSSESGACGRNHGEEEEDFSKASASASESYADQMLQAAEQMKKLNSKYQETIKSADNNTRFNQKIAENAQELKAQMDSMSVNLASLNKVYGGMLNAMEKK